MTKAARLTFSHGFTLLEMLVVLLIAGLLAGIALPGLHRAAASLEYANQRKDLLEQIRGLGYRAFASGEPIVIDNPQNKPLAASFPLGIPEGWKIEVPKPIYYGFNGVCSGGEIQVIAPDQTRTKLQLAPPLCQPSPA